MFQSYNFEDSEFRIRYYVRNKADKFKKIAGEYTGLSN